MFAKQISRGGGLTFIELMVAMAVLAIATFVRIKL
jgi:prepilin-type N-terminal cleavage/methylation domain-containing protein